ncbi:MULTISPECIES: DUF2207 domain-containing protein [Rhizobium]|uniref:DUF2207 domain-containing protein n=1 Tax=unclassified Rhizobium TaxID=2613769 RepID=UPI000CF24697|nr:DUF2207 domain-containing protein [Rhizobium tropici]UWU23435.1 DUF2207 domain-containing protein [Rhizobium tropici]
MEFVDAAGRKRRVDFSVISVERDGQPEEWRQETIDGGTRIYIGRPDKDGKTFLLDRGKHTFRVTYKTDRQFRFFDDYDELYWNVTGNGWQFPILQASATIILPDGVKPQRLAYFTGVANATGKNATAVQQPDKIVFSTTRPLAKGEGLTVSVMLPKGSIVVPDDAPALIAAAALGLLVLVVYHLVAWRRAGRKSSPRVLVPGWDPPENVSPAVANYIDNKGFPNGVGAAMSAALLGLAVKGYVKLDDLGERLLVHSTGKPLPEALDNSEFVLMNAVGPRDPLVFDRKNDAELKRVAWAFRKVIERDHEGRYFKSNASYRGGSLLLTLAALGVVSMSGRDSGGFVMALVFGLFALTIGGLTTFLRRRGVSRQTRLSAIWCLVVLFGFIALVFVGAIASDRPGTVRPEGILLAGLIMAIVGVNFVFAPFIETWTKLGARAIGKIERLRQYLSLVDEGRMVVQDDIRTSPEHFEELLPYAVALGVEKKWSQVFETWITKAAGGSAGLERASSYQPSWCRRHEHYHHHHHHGLGWVSDVAALPSAVAAFIPSTSSPTPVSATASAFSGNESSESTSRNDSSDDPPNQRGGAVGGGGGGGGGGGW